MLDLKFLYRFEQTGKKIYRITAIIDCDAKKLSQKLADTRDLTTWNKTLVKHQQIKVLLGPNVSLILS